MDYKKMAKYVLENSKVIATKIDQDYAVMKNKMIVFYLETIKEWIIPLPDHFEWEDDGCPYDSSGIIVADGFISLDQTINDFLEKEYTGERMPSFISGMGFYYRTYGDKISDICSDRSWHHMLKIIKNTLEEAFSVRLTDDDISEIQSLSHEFDDIYTNCLVFDFYSYEGLLPFLGIGNIKLNEIDSYHTPDREIREE